MASEIHFSIITPVRNMVDKLCSTQESILSQMPGTFEWIVVDGASSDGTAEWLKARQGDFHLWISEPDNGVYDAMNKGINLARGQFLIFLGAGDRLLPDCLENMVTFIEEHSSRYCRLIYGDVNELHTGRPLTSGLFTKSRLSRENMCHQGIFYDRRIFETLGGYELAYPIMADWAFNLRCFGNSKIAKLYYPRPVAEFEGGGLSTVAVDIPFAQNRLKMIRERLGGLYAWKFRAELALKRRLLWLN